MWFASAVGLVSHRRGEALTPAAVRMRPEQDVGGGRPATGSHGREMSTLGGPGNGLYFGGGVGRPWK